MTTLLLRLAGPMQAWGVQSRFSVRDTGQEPSKSGVIGLLCAALGKPRLETASDGFPALLAHLAALRMGVRVDREGRVAMDFQTAGGTHRAGERYGVVKADGTSGETVTSRRYYLADASFLVGLEGPRDLLALLHASLAAPRWQLFLGRKAMVPSEPIRLPDQPPVGPGLRDESLERALARYPRPLADAALRLVVEAPEGAELRQDVPLDFAARRFGVRYVQTTFLGRETA